MFIAVSSLPFLSFSISMSIFHHHRSDLINLQERNVFQKSKVKLRMTTVLHSRYNYPRQSLLLRIGWVDVCKKMHPRFSLWAKLMHGDKRAGVIVPKSCKISRSLPLRDVNGSEIARYVRISTHFSPIINVINQNGVSRV